MRIPIHIMKKKWMHYISQLLVNLTKGYALVKNRGVRLDNSYYRVECVDNMTYETQGGYMCAAMMMLSHISGVNPELDDENILKALSESKSPELMELLSLIVGLGDIPIPSVYKEDKKNHICLYNEEEFYEAIDILAEVSELLEEMTSGKYSLYYKTFDYVPEEEILYEDGYQIVISRDLYENIKDDYPYNSLLLALQILEERDNEDWDF